MEFGILGPVSVTHAGEDIGPARGHQRALLAALLVHANEAVSVDRLEDALWASPPASAAHAIEVHISALRRRLRDGGVRIVTRPGGYALLVADDELDAARFEALARRAREHLADGDATSAVMAFRAAERLWRGDAFGELGAEAFARPEATRLDALRVACRSDRLSAELAAGHHREIIAELEALSVAEPWHERLHGQLMLALYRDGRPADALDVYRRLRARLVEELGIEPGPAIEGLQLAILRHDPVLAAPAAPGRPPDGPTETVAPTIPASPDAPAGERRDRRAEPHAERRLVTAFLVDLVLPTTSPDGTTDEATRPRPSRRDPEVARGLQRRLVEAVTSVALAAGAIVVSLVDGGAMAVFGAAHAREDHAEQAFEAALALRDQLEAGVGPPDLAATIVIDSGEVIVEPGPPGAAGIIGGPVGDLLPLRDLAPGGAIMVGSRASAAAARSQFTFGPTQHGTTRGRSVTGRALLGRSASDGLADRLRRLVGRGRELGELDRMWARVIEDRSPRLAIIMGDPGIGKSALVRGWTAAAEVGGASVTRGRCLAYGQGVTYWPLAEVLRDRLGLDGDMEPTEILERLGEHRILGLTLGLDVTPDLHPNAAQRRLHEAWVTFLEAQVAEHPLVVVLEDLHWAEAPLIELIGTLVRSVRGPLLILVTARPEFSATAGGIESGRQVGVLWLEALSETDARQLAQDRLGAIPPAAISQVLDRAEGNPFFLEELLESLIERGAIPRAGDGPALATSLEDPLPDSVRSVLASRLDVLDPAPRQTLQVASVVGRRFDVEAVTALLDGPPADLDDLVTREFLRRLPVGTDGGPRYGFKHALTRDAAYETLTLARRAHLHAALAVYLERDGSGTTDHAAIVAYHYLEAVAEDTAALAWEDDPAVLADLEGRARRWAVDAARTAVARYGIDDAVSLLERALTCHPPRSEASAMWLEIGRANILRYDGVGFWSAMDAAIDQAATDAERAAIYAELAFETAFRWAIWTRMPERDQVDGWIDRTLELAPPSSRARAYGLVARTYWHPLDAGDAPTQALAIAERLDDPVVLSYALDARALTDFAAGDDLAAFATWERRTALAPRITDLDHLEDLYGAAIAGNAALGRFDEARRYADRHDEVAMQLSSHHQLHAVAMHLELEELAGGWPRMRELTGRAERAVAANLATPCVRNERSLLACALAAARDGDFEESRRLEDAAEALGMQGYESVFDPVRVRIAIARGETASIVDRLPLRMPPPSKNWWRLNTVLTRLEAGLALGDEDATTREAAPLDVPGTLLQAYAERAVGAATGDAARSESAAARFEAMGIRADALLTSTPDPKR